MRMRSRRARIRTVLTIITVALLLGAGTGTATAIAPEGGAPTLPFRLQVALQGYDRPLAAVSDGSWRRLFIVEQPGRIHVATRDAVAGPWTKRGVFLDLRSLITGPFIGRGLLGLAFHPQYATNGRFYVWYTRKSSVAAQNGDTVLAEYRRSSALRADPASHRWLLVLDQPGNFHFGGWMEFGPDGYLYLSTGDGAMSGVTKPQDVRTRFGKLLRIDPRDPVGAARYSIPPDNPFVGTTGDDAVWAYGLRNPWRGSFDPATGALWLADVGHGRYEEVNRSAGPDAGKGVNYGWYLCEGRHEYDPDSTPPGPCTTPGLKLPVVEYGHAGPDCSVIGGYVYRGTKQPSMVGRYVFGDYCSGKIWSIPVSYRASQPLPAPMDTSLNITSFGRDAIGELYVVGAHGTVHRILGT